MIKRVAMGVAMFAICCITFAVIPSAFGFEDYITGESAVQEEVIENDSHGTGESGFYYDVPADEADEKDTIGDQETVTHEEGQETVQNLDLDDEEQAVIK